MEERFNCCEKKIGWINRKATQDLQRGQHFHTPLSSRIRNNKQNNQYLQFSIF